MNCCSFSSGYDTHPAPPSRPTVVKSYDLENDPWIFRNIKIPRISACIKFIKFTSQFRFATNIYSVPNNTGAAVVCLFAVQTNRFGIIICLERTHTVSRHQPVSGSVCCFVLKGRRQSLNSLLSIFPNPCWKRLFCINVNFTKLLPAGCGINCEAVEKTNTIIYRQIWGLKCEDKDLSEHFRQDPFNQDLPLASDQ